MSSSAAAPPDRLGPPASALAWLREQGVDVDALEPRRRRYAVPGRWVGKTSGLVVRVAQDEAARRWLALERLRAEWAVAHGIPTPAVLIHCPDVLVTARCAQDPQRGRPFVLTAVQIASAVEGAALPPVLAGATQPARPQVARSRARSFAQGVRHGVDWREFADLRRAAAALPRPVTVHGDFHGANLLHDAAAGRTVLIDWEDAGPGPRGDDLLTLWPRLAEPDDRALLLEHVLSASHDLGATAVLHRWHAVRFLADLSTSPVPPAPGVLAGARSRVREAREQARRRRG